MTTRQPEWQFIVNLGDRNPLDYSSYFIFEDKTGVYAPEAVLTEPQNEEATKHKVYWFILEPCTFINGILSDNKLYPQLPAWFAGTEEQRKARPQATTYLKNISDFVGMDVIRLVNMSCSENLQSRAMAWHTVGEYHGFHNLDSYPLEMSREELERWMAENGVDPAKQTI